MPDTPAFIHQSPLQPDVVTMLQAAFPNGHSAFIPLLVDMMKLHSDKNHDYAHGGSVLGNFERVSAILKQYPDLKLADPVVVMLVYALKQLDAALWALCKHHEANYEGPAERLGDVMVYAGIAICALKDRQPEEPPF